MDEILLKKKGGLYIKKISHLGIQFFASSVIRHARFENVKLTFLGASPSENSSKNWRMPLFEIGRAHV